jgi:hypothetical protein
MAQKHHLIPVNLVRSTLTIAMADPSNLVAINEVKFLTGYDVKIAVAGATAISGRSTTTAAANYDQMLTGSRERRRPAGPGRGGVNLRTSSARPKRRPSCVW